MLRHLLATVTMHALRHRATAALSGALYKIVTTAERGADIQIGGDFAQLVAPNASIHLEVLRSTRLGPIAVPGRSRPGQGLRADLRAPGVSAGVIPVRGGATSTAA